MISVFNQKTSALSTETRDLQKSKTTLETQTAITARELLVSNLGDGGWAE